MTWWVITVCGTLLSELSKFHVFCVPNSAFAESGSTPRVFSKVLKLTLTHNCWDNNSLRKARMCQDNLFINLLLSQGTNEMSLKGLKIIGSLPMKFQLYALTGPLFGSYIKVCHRDFYSLGMNRGQLATVFSRWQNNDIYCAIYSIFSFS